MGNLLILPWNVTKKIKLQSPTKDDRFKFGFSVALRGYTIFSGSPKEPAKYDDVYKQVGGYILQLRI